MREEYMFSVLPTPTDADKMGRFGRYWYIGKTEISADYISPVDTSVYLYSWATFLLSLCNYNSPTDWARELLKTSKDVASLLVGIFLK